VRDNLNRLVTPFAVFLLMFCAVEVCFACDCVTLPEKESFQNADVVFEGEVVRINETTGDITYTFRVQKSLKGVNSGEVTIVEGHTNCDSVFAKDVIYRVYAKTFQNKLSAGQCSGTKVLGFFRRTSIQGSQWWHAPSWFERNKDVLMVLSLAVVMSLIIWLSLGIWRKSR
jgi:hypothetical protein